MTVHAWVKAIFDHPVNNPAWYWSDDASIPDDNPALSAAMLAELYEQPKQLLSAYSDAQANQGLWLLTSTHCSNISYALLDTSVPAELRHRAVASMSILFECYFAVRCSDHLSHLDEPGANPLNSVCYMWWDIFPAWPDEHASAPSETDLLCLGVMIKALQLDSVACRESALHGLGHWSSVLPHHTKPIITRFIAQSRGARPELLRYAYRARDSVVQ